MNEDLHFVDAWRARLEGAGLGDFEAMISGEPGRCVSYHTRGQTFRIELDGETIFLKRDWVTTIKDVLTDLGYLSLPQPPCIVEVRAIGRVRALGIPAPEVVAWSRETGVPVIAVTDEDLSQITVWKRRYRGDFPPIAVDPFRQSHQALAVVELPTFVHIGADGQVLAVQHGYSKLKGLFP